MLIADRAQFCGQCGMPVAGSTQTEKRPIAAIAVVAIFGVIGAVWSTSAIFKAVSSNPAGIEATLY